MEVYQRRLEERRDFARRALRFERRINRIRRLRAVRLALKLRHSRPGQIAAKPLRPLAQRLRRM